VRRGLSALVTVVTVFAICLAVTLMVLPPLFHLQRYVITGGSMEPTIHKGAIVFDSVVPVASLRVGDVVTFTPPDHTSQVTHRIVAARKGDAGQLLFRTRGDANRYGDPWQVTFPGTVQARYWFSIPYLGYLLGILSFRSVRMLVLALPAFLIGISFLVSVWRDIAAERRKERLVALCPAEGES
jgi:signal peptidase